MSIFGFSIFLAEQIIQATTQLVHVHGDFAWRLESNPLVHNDMMLAVIHGDVPPEEKYRVGAHNRTVVNINFMCFHFLQVNEPRTPKYALFVVNRTRMDKHAAALIKFGYRAAQVTAWITFIYSEFSSSPSLPQNPTSRSALRN
eukprot:8138_1